MCQLKLLSNGVNILSKSPSSHVDGAITRDFVARSSASRPKNHASLAKTFSPGILVRSTCGKSAVIMVPPVAYAWNQLLTWHRGLIVNENLLFSSIFFYFVCLG